MSSKNPRISIILPCYNASLFISEVIKSITNQSFKDFECIIINDGSTDNTLEILRTFEDERLKIFSQDNKGLSDTRNFGISKATGEFIFFCDSDDLLPENALKNLLDAYTGLEDIIIGKTATYLWNEKKSISILPHSPIDIKYDNTNKEVLFENIKNGLSPIAQNKLYKTSFIKKYKLAFRSKIFHEDELWFFETQFWARNVRFVDQITYNYTIDNSESITKKISDKNLLGYVEVLKCIFDKYYIPSPKIPIIAYYIAYIKKLILHLYLVQDYPFSGIAIDKTLEIFKIANPKFPITNQLKKKDQLYYQYINYISLLDLSAIRKLYFNKPINSFRKYLRIATFMLNRR